MNRRLDLATLVGVVSGMLLMCAAMLMGGGLGMFINIPSMLIVVGGTIAATLVNFPLREVLGVVRVAHNSIFAVCESPDDLIDRLVKYTGIAKKDGMLALEETTREIQNPLLRTGMTYIIDGMTPEEVTNNLRLKLVATKARHKAGQEVFKSMGKWSPAFGMIGTLIGLVQMLATMDDPKSIGPKMAVALLTTFYGALMANLIFLPMAGKLARRTEIEMVTGHLIVEGLIGLQAGMSPMLMESKLTAFLVSHPRKDKASAPETETAAPVKEKQPADVA